MMITAAYVRYRAVAGGLGALLLILAGTMLLPLPWSFTPGAESWRPLLLSALPTAAAGGLLRLLGRGTTELRRRDTYLLVTLAWLLAATAGALPYMFSGVLPSFTNAFFESMSGFTTTGASVITDVEVVPPGILFWRSLTHWLGGMGIMVLLVAMLSALGMGGLQVMKAEAPGPTVERVATRVRETAQALWIAYVVLTAAQVLCLWALGMSLFDALNHSFATLATGGFSTRNASLGAFTPAMQWVTTLFMYLAGVNFALFVGAFQSRSPGPIWRDPEFRLYTWVTVGSGVALTILIAGPKMGLLDALRHGAFQASSIMTTTGFATHDFDQWPWAAKWILGLLSVIGASTGSTGGAVKIMRFLVLIKQAAGEFARQIQPRVVRQVKLGSRVVPEELVVNIQQFFFLYMAVLGAGTLILSATGLDLLSSLSAAGATLGNIGPGLGVVGPMTNYNALTDVATWTGSVLMLLGRLELWTVLVLFSPAFWRR
ncbi:MAG TPA: TrkH family potassium uptake protein [Symbiobacteriaceae bacterium]|nr:TrkH family potassium uptake protein [Symbiobacteriaceae bacterium]